MRVEFQYFLKNKPRQDSLTKLSMHLSFSPSLPLSLSLSLSLSIYIYIYIYIRRLYDPQETDLKDVTFYNWRQIIVARTFSCIYLICIFWPSLLSYIYIYIYIYMQFMVVTISHSRLVVEQMWYYFKSAQYLWLNHYVCLLFVWVLWHILLCRSFKAKSIFMQIVLFQTSQLNMSTQFNCQKHFYFK